MSNGPACVGIIMDGNRRFAKAKGLPAWQGHVAGKKALLELLDAYAALRKKYGTAHYVFYAFSSENWKRSPAEVQKLLALVEEAFADIESRLAQAKEDKVRIRFVGDTTKFNAKTRRQFARLEEETAHNTKGTIAFALSYGGRDELVRAVRKLSTDGANLPKLTEAKLSGALDTAGIPDPDLIIRTGGAQRLSNFLLWQSAYSELFFTPTLWPDFSVKKLEELFAEFAKTKRNFGT